MLLVRKLVIKQTGSSLPLKPLGQPHRNLRARVTAAEISPSFHVFLVAFTQKYTFQKTSLYQIQPYPRGNTRAPSPRLTTPKTDVERTLRRLGVAAAYLLRIALFSSPYWRTNHEGTRRNAIGVRVSDKGPGRTGVVLVRRIVSAACRIPRTQSSPADFRRRVRLVRSPPPPLTPGARVCVCARPRVRVPEETNFSLPRPTHAVHASSFPSRTRPMTTLRFMQWHLEYT